MRNSKNLKIDAPNANQDLNLFLENAAIPAEAGAPTPYQQHDYSPMDSGLPLRPKQLGGAQARPESFGAGRDDTQPGDFDAISQPGEDIASALGDPSAH